MKASSKQQKSSMHAHAKAASAGPNGIAVAAKAESESFSGFSQGDARMHAHASEPVQLQTSTSAPGADIYGIPGAHVIGASTFQFMNNRPEAKQAAQLQAMADNHSSSVIQRKPLNANLLNVVGEQHLRSGKSRRWEAEYANMVAGGPYWQENEFKVNIPKPGGALGETVSAFGDSKILLMANTIHFNTNILSNIVRFLKRLPSVNATRYNLSLSKQQVFDTCCNLIKQHIPTLKAWGQEYKKLKPKALAELPNRPDFEPICNLYIEIGDAFFNDFLTGIDHWVSNTSALNTDGVNPAQLNQAAQAGALFIPMGTRLIVKIFEKEDVSFSEHQDGYQRVIFGRSNTMHDSATRGKDIKGVWKIGNTHVTDIKQILEGADPSYELMTEDEFFADFNKWLPTYPVYQAFQYGMELADIYDWSESTVFEMAKAGHFDEMIRVRQREALRRDPTPSYIS